MIDVAAFSPSVQKLLENPGALCNMARRAALGAGDILLRYFEGELEPEITVKEDGTPVSNADREAEDDIVAGLQKILPGVPVIAEEAVSRGEIPDISAGPYFWLVDALDGTKEFIKGEMDFTVNIALVHEGRPILGVIYAPAKGVLYSGHGPGTALRWNADKDQEKEIFVRKPQAEGLIVLTGQMHVQPQRLEQFLSQFKVAKHIKRSSSIKLCQIAEGKADIYPRLGKSAAWDIAAGHAILLSAGGDITDNKGEALVYSGVNGFENPEFVASGFVWHEGLFEA